MNEIDDEEIVSVDAPFRRIEKVAALDGYRVMVKWMDGPQVAADLAPSILGFKVYAPLRDDRALFESVHVVNAFAIAWGDDDAIDMHVSEVDRLASEIMETQSFRAFLKDMEWTWDTAAAQLGISRRMVGYYARGTVIPRYIALACAHLRWTTET